MGASLGWVGAYELTHDARYLEMAELIFADMTGGWDDTCGGGIWWKKPKQYKNAIANELFLSVTARLASLTPDAQKRVTYLDWAKREWKWFAASGMINSENLVNDGLDSACHNNHQTTWTYNQGVILGGLSALAKQSGDRKPLEVAQSIALAAMARLTDLDGVLHDSCEPARCGNDATQFKGIFSRNLAALNSAAPVPGFRTFLRKNAESIWKNRDADNQFGVVWSGPSDVKNAATRVSPWTLWWPPPNRRAPPPISRPHFQQAFGGDEAMHALLQFGEIARRRIDARHPCRTFSTQNANSGRHK